MKNGLCPRCNGTEIYTQPGSRFQSELVTLKAGPIGKSAYPDRYLCATCGYVEYYVTSAEDLQVARETWTKVSR